MMKLIHDYLIGSESRLAYQIISRPREKISMWYQEKHKLMPGFSIKCIDHKPEYES